ncbi:hypothetical protein BC828DRAFT_401903 [Blastocladiella britannica]|nr:hypothetical protein BC828DRAFT_401903 [Blastocladiella britannica]
MAPTGIGAVATPPLAVSTESLEGQASKSAASPRNASSATTRHAAAPSSPAAAGSSSLSRSPRGRVFSSGSVGTGLHPLPGRHSQTDLTGAPRTSSYVASPPDSNQKLTQGERKGSLSTLLRMSKKKSTSSASLLASHHDPAAIGSSSTALAIDSSGSRGKLLDPSNVVEEDTDGDGFSEWHTQLMSDVAVLPAVPQRDLPLPASMELMTGRALFGDIAPTSVAGLMEAATRYLYAEHQHLGTGALAPPTPAMPPVHMIAPEEAKPFALQFDGQTPAASGSPTSESGGEDTQSSTVGVLLQHVLTRRSESALGALGTINQSTPMSSTDTSSTGGSTRTTTGRANSASAASARTATKSVLPGNSALSAPPVALVDDAAAATFLALYRLHADPATLLVTLIKAFTPPAGTRDRASIQRNVERIARVWLFMFYDDVSLTVGLEKRIKEWVAELERLGKDPSAPDSAAYHLAACTLGPALNARTRMNVMARLQGFATGAPGPSAVAASSTSPNRVPSPFPESPASFSAGSPAPTSASTTSTKLPEGALHLDAMDISSLTTLFLAADRHYASIVSLPVLDLVARRGIVRTHGTLRSFRRYLAYSTELYRWVLHGVHNAQGARRRCAAVKRAIKLAVALVDAGAMNSACILIGALRSPWIVFQRGLWEDMEPKYIRLMRSLLDHVDPADQFEKYRTYVSSTGPVTKVPCLALHLALASHFQIPTNPRGSTSWLTIYLPMVKILMDLQSSTGSVNPYPPPDPGLLLALGAVAPFDATAAWNMDIRILTQEKLEEHIARYRPALPVSTLAASGTAGGGGGGSTGGGSSALTGGPTAPTARGRLRTLSGSVASLFGAGSGNGGAAGSRGWRSQSLRGGAGAAVGSSPMLADQESSGSGTTSEIERDAATLFGLDGTDEENQPQPPPPSSPTIVAPPKSSSSSDVPADADAATTAPPGLPSP